MRLSRFSIRNFKSISEASFNWEDFVVFIGENNSGKSTVLSAINTFLLGSSIRDQSLFRGHRSDAENAIELTGEFSDLTPSEMDEVAVRGRMHDGKWILKKRYFSEESNEDGETKITWHEQLFSFSADVVYVGWPEQDTSWKNFPNEYGPLIEQLGAGRPNAATKLQLKELVAAQKPELVAAAAAAWVANPGGGGNWKSNANSILPRSIFVRAVHEASDETDAKNATAYGKLINLLVERQLSERVEIVNLRAAIERVMALFQPDPAKAETQAEEVAALQSKINERLAQVVAGEAVIRTELPAVEDLVMPNTSLVIRDAAGGIETGVEHQGHGLQRTLVMTLLQLLSEAQASAPEAKARPTILLVEEPELYLHPHMERLMRDALYKVADQPTMQVACCTHSPVFLDLVDRYRAIGRVIKADDGSVSVLQVNEDLFPEDGPDADKWKLQTIARFHPSVNELFFAKQVVLFEEDSAIASFERAAALMGIFGRHPRLMREVTFIDCKGKGSIPGFQRILKGMKIPYRVMHDADEGNAQAERESTKIREHLSPDHLDCIFLVGPGDLEGLLGHTLVGKEAKPTAAVRQVERLFAAGALPDSLVRAVCFAYFAAEAEPVA